MKKIFVVAGALLLPMGTLGCASEKDEAVLSLQDSCDSFETSLADIDNALDGDVDPLGDPEGFKEQSEIFSQNLKQAAEDVKDSSLKEIVVPWADGMSESMTILANNFLGDNAGSLEVEDQEHLSEVTTSVADLSKELINACPNLKPVLDPSDKIAQS